MDQQLHADNCVGQNKNNTVMQVCMSQIIIITTVNYCYFLIVPSTVNHGWLKSFHYFVIHGG